MNLLSAVHGLRVRHLRRPTAAPAVTGDTRQGHRHDLGSLPAQVLFRQNPGSHSTSRSRQTIRTMDSHSLLSFRDSQRSRAASDRPILTLSLILLSFG